MYFWLNKKRLTYASKGWLVFCSLFFYSWWNIIYLPLILGSILFNFTLGSAISKITSAKSVSKQALLTFAIILNLLLLGYFKYMDFFILNTNIFLHTQIEFMHIILPLGISFFTFTQIAYLVDAYRGEVKEMDYLNYTLFVTFFPHLLAGPILHHKEMMPQFDAVKNKIFNYKNISLGLFIFTVGLFKKLVIADTFAVWANIGFDTATTLNFFEAWATSLSYTIQLYFDFSGYTDMAIGLALLFNITLPINFNKPYKAKNIQDFWRSWHITLSRFLKNYVYIPLGGNRNGEFRTYSNLLATFIIGGIWHGANWTFVFWGFLHGIGIIIFLLWSKLGIKLWNWLAWFITFNFVNFAWIFFRAKNWNDTIKVLSGMVGLNGIEISNNLYTYLNFLSAYHIHFGPWLAAIGDTNSKWILVWFAFATTILLLKYTTVEYAKNKFQKNIKHAVITSILILINLFYLNQKTPFLYFNF